MALACQKNSYLKELTSKVKRCEAGTLTTLVNGKKTKLAGFNVVLDDTVLFPEGGGQPDDRGTLNDVSVLRVTRVGTDAVHFVPTPMDVGEEMKVVVDWQRRWDHMQQHSGQHLVTAIADTEFGFATMSWNLGEKISSIELNTPTITPEQIERIEAIVNEKIRAGIPMYPTLFESGDDPKLKEIRTRGLPDDHEGAVRVVTIAGIEDNMCCGTHVSNLSHLQMIKILGTDKAHKGHINILFLAGERCLAYMGRAWQHDKELTAKLKGGPEKHAELVEKLLTSYKAAQKAQLSLLRDLAKMEVAQFKANPRPILVLHRREGDQEFMNTIVNEINDPSVLILVTVGEDNGAGMFVFSGSDDAVQKLGPQVAGLLDGKGAGKRGRFQGKANKLQKRPEVEKLLQQYLDNPADQ